MRWRQKPREEIGYNEVLTQYGNSRSLVDGRPFRCRPKDPGMINAVSVYRGRGTIAQLVARVSPSYGRQPRRGDGVRYTTAGKLKEAGFVAVPKPNERFPEHVSVFLLDEEQDWTHPEAQRFDACFDNPVWEEGGDD